jgi:hypothetical protein
MASAPATNPLVDILLTVILPSAALEWLSPANRLGPFWALALASALPIGFGIYCWRIKAGLNFFSILGLIAVILTGGLGLLKLDALWFAIKEASVPLVLGLAFPLSHLWGKPVVKSILFAPHIINEAVVTKAIKTPEQSKALDQLMWRAALGLGGMTMCSAIANFALAMYLLGDKTPGSEPYVKAIGTLNWGGLVVIGLPLMVVMMIIVMRFLKGLQTITGLEQADIMNAGQTVRRQV